MAKATGLQVALLDEPPSPLLDELPQEASALRAKDTRIFCKLVDFIFKHLGTADG
jgi:hypothetical protein